jgi:hypothetical protein
MRAKIQRFLFRGGFFAADRAENAEFTHRLQFLRAFRVLRGKSVSCGSSTARQLMPATACHSSESLISPRLIETPAT